MSVDEKQLSEKFWKVPPVFDRATLVDPFFTKRPLMLFLNTNTVDYFVEGLVELSQLVHVVAINAPLPGPQVNHVLREFLAFHVEHFVSISLRDSNVMCDLAARFPNDAEVKAFVVFLQQASKEFLVLWDAAYGGLKTSMSDVMRLQRDWVAVKSVANAISLQASLIPNLAARLELRIPLWRRLDIYTTQGSFPNWLVYVWLFWGISVAFTVDIIAWVLVLVPSVPCAFISNFVCTTGFGGFLLFFYTLCRRRTLSEWYAKEMSGNLSGSYFSNSVLGGSSDAQRDGTIDFHIQPMNSGIVSVLSIPSTVINRQVVMIGISDLSTLQICSWNTCAREATGITSQEAIGKTLRAVMDPESVRAVRLFFEELQHDPQRQKRLLFNSLRKSTVAVNACATVARVDGSPVFMLVGTVLEEQEQMMMSHFSRSSLSVLQSKLEEQQAVDAVTRELLVSASWDDLKERTTQALRSWRFSTVDELCEPFQRSGPHLRVSVTFGNDIPTQFQCDSSVIRAITGKICDSLKTQCCTAAVQNPCSCTPSTSSTSSVSCMNVRVGVVQHDRYRCCLLELQLNSTCPLTLADELIGTIRAVGYVYSQTSHRLVVRFPMTTSPIGGNKPEGLQVSPAGLFVCTFVIFEPDSVYSMHLTKFLERYQYRTFLVSPTNPEASLTQMLEGIGRDVTAVFLSSSSPKFEALLTICKSRAVFTVCTHTTAANTSTAQRGVAQLTFKTRFSAGNSAGVAGVAPIGFAGGAGGASPISDLATDYRLHLPLNEKSWEKFSAALTEVRQHKSTVDGALQHNYEELRSLASGAFGRVDLVRELFSQGVMARKTIFVTPERPLKAITAEVRVMSAVGLHPHVVGFISSYTRGSNEYCLLMEYCKAGSITELLSRTKGNCLRLELVALFTKELLSAVAHIHSRGVAHRDIKPANIFMTDALHLKLGDFGSATQDPADAGKLAGGTIPFLAPERVISIPSTCESATNAMSRLFAEDIWSVGITMLYFANLIPSEFRHSTEMNEYVDLFMNWRNGKSVPQLPRTPPPALECSPAEFDLFLSFAKEVLIFEPDKRKSAEELLRHPFLAHVTVPEPEEDDTEQVAESHHTPPPPPPREGDVADVRVSSFDPEEPPDAVQMSHAIHFDDSDADEWG